MKNTYPSVAFKSNYEVLLRAKWCGLGLDTKYTLFKRDGENGNYTRDIYMMACQNINLINYKESVPAEFCNPLCQSWTTCPDSPVSELSQHHTWYGGSFCNNGVSDSLPQMIPYVISYTASQHHGNNHRAAQTTAKNQFSRQSSENLCALSGQQYELVSPLMCSYVSVAVVHQVLFSGRM